MKSKTGSIVILTVLVVLAVIGVGAWAGSNPPIVTVGTVTYPSNTSNTFACSSGNDSCTVTFIAGSTWSYLSNRSREAVIHADNGDDIQVIFEDGALSLENGEHAIFTYVPQGKYGDYLLLSVHKLDN